MTSGQWEIQQKNLSAMVKDIRPSGSQLWPERSTSNPCPWVCDYFFSFLESTDLKRLKNILIQHGQLSGCIGGGNIKSLCEWPQGSDRTVSKAEGKKEEGKQSFRRNDWLAKLHRIISHSLMVKDHRWTIGQRSLDQNLCYLVTGVATYKVKFSHLQSPSLTCSTSAWPECSLCSFIVCACLNCVHPSVLFCSVFTNPFLSILFVQSFACF